MLKPTKGVIEGDKVLIRGKTNLRSGDKVVVVEPTKEVVLSSRTGRVLGFDERVIGRGHVINSNGEICILINSLESAENLRVRSVSPSYSRHKTEKRKNVLIKILNEKNV